MNKTLFHFLSCLLVGVFAFTGVCIADSPATPTDLVGHDQLIIAGENETVNVTVTDNIVTSLDPEEYYTGSSETGNYHAVYIQGDEDSTITVSISGDIITQGNCALYAITEEGNETTIVVDGKVETNADWEVVEIVSHNADMNVSVSQGVDVHSESIGSAVSLRTEGNDSSIVFIVSDGDLVSNDDDEGSVFPSSMGLDAVNIGGNIDVNINGSIDVGDVGIVLHSGTEYELVLSSNTEPVSDIGINTDYIYTVKDLEGNKKQYPTKLIENDDGTVIFYYIDEDNIPRRLEYVDSKRAGETNIRIQGDVKAVYEGITIFGNVADIKKNVIIDGRLSAMTPIMINNIPEEDISDQFNLTVWKIETSLPEGALTDGRVANEEYHAYQEYEKTIQYIIKVDPNQEEIIAAEGTADFKGYEVANEGDTISLKLDIPKGYIISAVYGDTNKQTKLKKNENGNYVLTVPKGGGVFLSLKLQQKIYVKALFYPNGGMINGSEGIYTKSMLKSSKICLPEPEARDGYIFAGWYPSDITPDSEAWIEPVADDPNLLPAGSEYVINRETYFIAIWKNAE